MTKRENRYSCFSTNAKSRTVYGELRRKSNLTLEKMSFQNLVMPQWVTTFS